MRRPSRVRTAQHSAPTSALAGDSRRNRPSAPVSWRRSRTSRVTADSEETVAVVIRDRKRLGADYLRRLMRTDATGEGGSSYGDSGSPKLFEPVPGELSNMAAAITTGGAGGAGLRTTASAWTLPAVRAWPDLGRPGVGEGGAQPRSASAPEGRCPLREGEASTSMRLLVGANEQTDEPNVATGNAAGGATGGPPGLLRAPWPVAAGGIQSR
jgi:hypothetical protein